MLHLGVAGSYSSALVRELLLFFMPPTISTWPVGSSVAVWLERAVAKSATLNQADWAWASPGKQAAKHSTRPCK